MPNRVVREAGEPPAVVNTDDWRRYDRMAETGCARVSVCHAAREWARDGDGDGVREVHVNTMEGLWTGPRNFLRTFRGVNKKYLYQDVALFEWGYNIKPVTPEFIRAMLGVPITTFSPMSRWGYRPTTGEGPPPAAAAQSDSSTGGSTPGRPPWRRAGTPPRDTGGG
jgi:hypothetical protein